MTVDGFDDEGKGRPSASVTPLLCKNCAHFGSMNRPLCSHLSVLFSGVPINGSLCLGQAVPVKSLHRRADSRLATFQTIKLRAHDHELTTTSVFPHSSLNDRGKTHLVSHGWRSVIDCQGSCHANS